MHVIDQAALRDQLRALLRDPAGSAQRWTDAEIYAAINQVLMHWSNRVSIPQAYDLTLSAGVLEYSLPDYVTLPLRLDRQTSGGKWIGVGQLTLATNGTGGWALRLPTATTGQARVTWQEHNAPLPTTPPTVASLSADATTLTLAAVPINLSLTGYLRLASSGEYCRWIYDRAAQHFTLARGALGSTAAAVNAPTVANFCVTVPTLELIDYLINQAAANLHVLFVQVGAASDQPVHERAASYYQQRADAIWRSHIPQRSPLVRIAPVQQ